MTSILKAARFTSPVQLNQQQQQNDTKGSTTINTTQPLRETVFSTLTASSQPLTVTELTEAVSRLHEKAYVEAQIRLLVKELLAAGRITSRKETPAERQVRAGGKQVRSNLATLFWSGTGFVPKRTVTEAVPGFSIFPDKPQQVSFKKYAYKTKRHARKMDEVELVDVSDAFPSTQPSQNQIVDMLIEKIVAERTAELHQQLAAKEAELKKLKDFLKSAL